MLFSPSHSTSRLFLAAVLACATIASVGAREPAQASTASPAIPVEPASATVLDDGVLYRELTRGIYEAVVNPRDGLLYVASALAADNVSGGIIYKLNPQTLETVGAIHTDLRNFALALSPDGKRLYATNSVERGVTAFDLEKNEVIGRIRFDEKGKDGHYFGPRQVIYDQKKDLLYVGAVGNPGVIWVLDPQTLALRHKIENAGKWLTGLLVHPKTGDLYAANGGGEILLIDTGSFQIKQRFKPAGDAEAILLNLALDEARNHLYVTDHSKLKTTLIVDAASGRKIGEIAGAGDSMGIRHNPARKEIYISHREQGTVSIVDADTLAIKRTVRAAPNPNSLALSPDGKTLFVTVKTPFTKTYKASGVESIARIPLD